MKYVKIIGGIVEQVQPYSSNGFVEAPDNIVAGMMENKDGTFSVVEDYRYKDAWVPKGYVTNGANTPRLYWLICPPFQPKNLPAVVVHDFYCDMEKYTLADRFLEDMLDNSINSRVVVMAVKLYHKIRYGV